MSVMLVAHGCNVTSGLMKHNIDKLIISDNPFARYGNLIGFRINLIADIRRHAVDLNLTRKNKLLAFSS